MSRGTTQPLSPSREFKDGRWLNNTLTIKDAWVEKYYETVVNYRLGIEGDKDLQKQGVVICSIRVAIQEGELPGV